MKEEKRRRSFSTPTLKKHIDKQDLVMIYRTFGTKEITINGFILKKTTDLLLIKVIDQFLLNGYVIITRKHIDKIRCNKFDKAQHKILKAEGIIGKTIGMEHKIVDLSSWQRIFKDLKKFDYHVIVECETLPEPDITIYTIGPVKRALKKKVGVEFYDPAGVLENKDTMIRYDNITKVAFGDRYSSTFKKYVVQGK